MKKQKKPVKRGLKHHAKRIYHLTPRFVHGAVAGAFLGIMVVVGFRAGDSASAAVSLSGPKDCDTNAVINCGAFNTSDLKARYNNAGVASIYNYFKITSTDIKNIDKTAVSGRVYKDGKVKVNGVTVATNARTAGRENSRNAGSTKVTSGGVTFYTRTPSVSFNPDYITAFVAMQDGEFKFAILSACGNPVSATPIPKKEIPPATTTPPKEDTPVVPDTPSTQTPPSTPQPITPAAVVTAPPEELPHTGPGAVLIIAVLAIVGGYIFHMTHRHVNHKRRAKAVTRHPHAPAR